MPVAPILRAGALRPQPEGLKLLTALGSPPTPQISFPQGNGPAGALMAQIGKQNPDYTGFIQALKTLAARRMTDVPGRDGSSETTGATGPGQTFASSGALGKVLLAPGADRAGVHTNGAVIDFVRKIAGLYGQPLTIGTGTNHNEYVAGTNRQSAHWVGNAADIPSSGAALTRLGQAALIAAGMSPAQARKQTGGLFNLGGYQVIFNTNEGGNHFNHLHVGIRR